VLVDASGGVLDGAGAWDEPFFARSSVKALQALPLLETGAAERFAFDSADVALALASHDGEPCHVDRVRATLARLELAEPDLRCGPQAPGNSAARAALRRAGEKPSQLHNNCSGKHAGFLALARHLGVDSARYLDPASEGQRLVREAIADLTDVPRDGLEPEIDGCSAPTYRMPLRNLALAFARLANPEGLSAGRALLARRMTDAAAAHPELIAGSTGRLCTELARKSGGRLFPKIGAEGVYAIGVVGGQRGLAVKIDDGAERGLFALVLALVERLELLGEAELAGLANWRDPRLFNRAGLEVGRVEAVPA
jgi:L-asparaginase II